MELTNSQNIKDLLLKAFYFRHACKEFDPERKIPDEDFKVILEAGRLSSSSVGLEPWRFVIIQNQAIREKIRSVSWGAQRQAPTASHFMLVLARTIPDLRYDSDYVSHMVREVHQVPEEIAERLIDQNYKNFVESDFKLMESDRAMFDWSCKQAYIALSNMLTTAAIMGIDSCPIEGFDRDKIDQVLKEEDLLDDTHFGVACFAAFGYRVKEPRPKSRQNLEEIVEWVN